MTVWRNRARAWLLVAALLLSILTALFALEGAQAVTLARSYSPKAMTLVQDSPAQEASGVAQLSSAAQACVPVPGERFCSYMPLAAKDFSYAYLALSKSAAPATVTTIDGQEIVYTVTVQNTGDTPGQWTGAHDVLPAGFAFLGMAAGSDVTTPPAVSGQELTWSLAPALQMAPGEQKVLIYRAAHSTTAGQYTNLVTVSGAQASVPLEPAGATVTVEPGILLEDHFEADTKIDDWTPFLNYHRQAPGQWYWGNDDGYGGSGGATMDSDAVSGKEAHDGLLMYLADGAEEWTDYRMEAKMILRNAGHPSGFWIRGQWEDSDISGQWVTGYYAMVGGKVGRDEHYVRLLQLQTLEDCWGPPCPSSPEYIPGREVNLYNFNNPHDLTDTKRPGELARNQWHTLTVEVRGANIKIWLNGELYIDFTDPKEPFLNGTVGFKTYSANTVSYDDLVVTPLSD